MGTRDDARREIAETRERIGEIVEELSRRTSPAYVRARTREAAMQKTGEMRRKAMSSPTALGVVGGIVGSAAGMVLARRARARRQGPEQVEYEGGFERAGAREAVAEEPLTSGGAHGEAGAFSAGEIEAREAYGVGERGEAGQRGERFKERAARSREAIQQKASESREQVQEKAREVRERIGEKGRSVRAKAGGYREKIPSGEQVKGWYQRTVEEQPALLALGTLALGAAAALLFPMTEKERKVYQPVRQKARGEIASAEQKLEEKIAGEEARPEQREPAAYEEQTEEGRRVITPAEAASHPSNEPILH